MLTLPSQGTEDGTFSAAYWCKAWCKYMLYVYQTALCKCQAPGS